MWGERTNKQNPSPPHPSTIPTTQQTPPLLSSCLPAARDVRTNHPPAAATTSRDRPRGGGTKEREQRKTHALDKPHPHPRLRLRPRLTTFHLEWEDDRPGGGGDKGRGKTEEKRLRRRSPRERDVRDKLIRQRSLARASTRVEWVGRRNFNLQTHDLPPTKQRYGSTLR